MVKVYLLKSYYVSDFLMGSIFCIPSPETIQEILKLYLTIFQGQDEDDLQLLGKSAGPKSIKEGLIEITAEVAYRLDL